MVFLVVMLSIKFLAIIRNKGSRYSIRGKKYTLNVFDDRVAIISVWERIVIPFEALYFARIELVEEKVICLHSVFKLNFKKIGGELFEFYYTGKSLKDIGNAYEFIIKKIYENNDRPLHDFENDEKILEVYRNKVTLTPKNQVKSNLLFAKIFPYAALKDVEMKEAWGDKGYLKFILDGEEGLFAYRQENNTLYFNQSDNGQAEQIRTIVMTMKDSYVRNMRR
jgi:hypothetical protein